MKSNTLITKIIKNLLFNSIPLFSTVLMRKHSTMIGLKEKFIFSGWLEGNLAVRHLFIHSVC